MRTFVSKIERSYAFSMYGELPLLYALAEQGGGGANIVVIKYAAQRVGV